MRRAARAVLVVVLCVVGVVAVPWSMQRRLIYFPDRTAPPAVASTESVELSTSDGLRLTAWLVRPGAGDRRTAVLVAPGNAGNRRDRVPLAAALARVGFTVLLLDYRGYGGNPGRPTEAGLHRDAAAAWAYLTGPADFPPGRVILFGESLGAAVVANLAATPDLPTPGGLVLRSPFESLAAVGRVHYPWLPVGRLLIDRFDVAGPISRTTAPTVVVYGTADTVVPAVQSRAVAERAAKLVRLIAVEGADHNDAALAVGPPVVDAVVTLAPG